MQKKAVGVTPEAPNPTLASSSSDEMLAFFTKRGGRNPAEARQDLLIGLVWVKKDHIGAVPGDIVCRRLATSDAPLLVL